MTALEKLQTKLTPKQFDTLCFWMKERPAFTILSGGVRSGKSFLLALFFLIEAKKFKGQNMIIMGATISSVQRNILSLMELWLGKPIKLGKYNQFELFGNTVYVFGGDSADSYKAVRGFTSCLSMCNELTTLHETAIDEVINRTSVKGSMVIADTNPSYPTHFVKTKYIDKSGTRNEDGRLQVYTEHFTMLHNTTLSREYIDRMLTLFPKDTTEYDRNILGHWIVKEEGVIYNMFDEKKHLVDFIPADEPIDRYIGGVDWGFGHYGVALVMAKTRTGKFYLVEEVAKTEETFDFWRDTIKSLNDKYNVSIWYCDSARPEYVSQLSRVVKAVNANKNVLEGIDTVCRLFREDKLFMVRKAFVRGLDEIYKYRWKKTSTGKDEVLKEDDDVLDVIRYICYTETKNTEVKGLYNGITSFRYVKR